MKHPSPERRREIADDRFTCVFAQPDGSVLFPASGSIKEPLSEWTLCNTGHDTGHEVIQHYLDNTKVKNVFLLGAVHIDKMFKPWPC